ncbi:MAG TPA: pyrroloquinoline quinone biosynthesis protein PqqB [Steroidobacteraceae bacterium]|jgi:pyrroloquinoline quinone biosynthesis protein B|nr:pyrroloquinoline quinone biosynthesis protein PqqB [Steroidobacteraceae bacterium]
MKIKVLGSAAGGGFPQWNCGCPNCRGVRRGELKARARTQESLAVSADGDNWFLLNASPEIRAQIEAFPRLHPRGPRDSPIAGILITNGDLDHCLGLLSLRESQPLQIFATERVRRGFSEANALYATLERFAGQTTWRTLSLGEEQELKFLDGRTSGLEVQPLAVPGQPPLHLRGRFAPSPEDNVGLRIRDRANGRAMIYLSGVAAVTAEVLAGIDGAQCVFFDGTFWAADELITLGLGDKRAEDMAHLPIGGASGSLARLANIHVARRYFIHINNTNPILREDSAEHAAVEAAGWRVAYDGLELEL